MNRDFALNGAISPAVGSPPRIPAGGIVINITVMALNSNIQREMSQPVIGEILLAIELRLGPRQPIQYHWRRRERDD